MNYTLTEPKGQIVFRNNLFHGSQVEGNWSPFNPEQNQGWQDGDTLTVTCTFNLYPNGTKGPDFVGPNANQYMGLCVGALNKPTPGQIQNLKSRISGARIGNGKLFDGITTNATPSDNDIFYAAVSTALGTSQTLEGNDQYGSPRGTISGDLIYQWTMQYNASSNFDPTDIEIIFGYGDPMIDEEKT